MTADIQRVGQTGARFGRASRRAQADPQRPDVRSDDSGVAPLRTAPPSPVPPLPHPQRPPVPPQRGPLLSPLLGESAPRPAPQHRTPPYLPPEPQVDPDDFGFGDVGLSDVGFGDHGDSEIDHLAISAPTVRVRPYIHTGGRTRTSAPLPIETMVCTRPGVSPLRLNGAHRWVADLCSVPQSVAEVSARLGVPIAVARVVVDDLVEQCMVTVQRGVENRTPDLPLMQRVLAGLLKL